MTSNSQAPTRDVDEVLKETELGSFIAKNKGIVIGAVVGILIAIIGHGFYKQAEVSTNDAYNEKLFNFEKMELTNYVEDKTKVQELIAAVDKLHSEMGSYSGLTLILFSVSDELVKNGDLENALAILQKANTLADPYTTYFLVSRKAAILEDLKRPSEALAELEAMPDASKKLLEGKVYLDMGRLQLEVGDTARAKASFEYLQDKVVQDEFSKMAKYYLYQIDKKDKQDQGKATGEEQIAPPTEIK